jgi:hypothetical protein
MQDVLLNRTLRLTVVGTIAVLGFACLILCYQALYALITLDYTTGATNMGWGLGAGAAALLLIRYRNDLIET